MILIILFNYIMLFLLANSKVKCDLITPKTFPDNFVIDDDIEAENSINQVTNDKPWLAHVDLFTEKSISECSWQIRHDDSMNKMWKCVFLYQPSYQAMQQVLNNVCPRCHQVGGECLQKMKEDKHIFRKHTTETEPCFPVWFKGWKQTKVSFTVGYYFKLQTWLRLNVTFTIFELNLHESCYISPIYEYMFPKDYSTGQFRVSYFCHINGFLFCSL